MRIPTEIFRIRNSQLNSNQHVEFDLQLINSNKTSSEITRENFQLKIYPPHNAHLILIKELNQYEETELHIQMKIFTNYLLNSISMMKIFIYVSQYDFFSLIY